MKAISTLFRSSKELPIAVIQYERAGYGLGQEEHLHWAIVVPADQASLTGVCFQAIDRHYTDGRGTIWQLFSQDVELGKTKKCLGGVSIGSVNQRDLNALKEVVSTNPPTVKFEGWNCRDWVIEVIQLLRAKEWIRLHIPDQVTLLPRMRVASKATTDAYRAGQALPVIISFT